MLRVRGLWVRYKGGDWVLKNINFFADSGEFVLVAGESGSGKSTLARTLSGFIPRFYEGEVKGEVDVFGINPIQVGPSKLFGVLGFMGQDPSLYTISVDVEGEIVYPLEVAGFSPDDIERRLRLVSEAFDLESILYKSLIEISSGELQRTALASLYSVDPKVFILDEPMARLDPRTARRTALLLRDLADRGKLVIVFEHHLDEILPLSDRVIVLRDGQVVFDGCPRDALPFLRDVDLPIISELFMELRGDSKTLPLTVEEAVDFCE